jgi:molybdate transport system permease protein
MQARRARISVVSAAPLAVIIILGAGLLALLVVPFLALALASTPAELLAALRHPLVAPALWLSLRTTAISLAVVVLAGTPLAWYLARSRARWVPFVEALVEIPIVIPPAVVGIALLMTFGRSGVLGEWLAGLGWSLPFTSSAVVVAQIIVAAPFYIQSATAGFRKVDDDLVLVARTLGASPARAFLGIAIPSALPALISGAALAWARAVGEFGATLLFAGNMPGRTQTMPLAIYTALEADVRVAQAVALVLGVAAFATLLLIRVAPRLARLRAIRTGRWQREAAR